MTMIDASTLAAIAAAMPQSYLSIKPDRVCIVACEGAEIVHVKDNVWAMELMDYTCTINVRGSLRDVIEVAKQLGVS